MKRMNKTEKNIQKVWNDLDTVCGLLDNTLINLSSMVISDNLKNEIEAIDMSAIVSLKNRIEEIMEEKSK